MELELSQFRELSWRIESSESRARVELTQRVKEANQVRELSLS